jgi:hypothetical protein
VEWRPLRRVDMSFIAQITVNGYLRDSLRGLGLGSFVLDGTSSQEVETGRILDPDSRPSLMRVSTTSRNSARCV